VAQEETHELQRAVDQRSIRIRPPGPSVTPITGVPRVVKLHLDPRRGYRRTSAARDSSPGSNRTRHESELGVVHVTLRSRSLRSDSDMVSEVAGEPIRACGQARPRFSSALDPDSAEVVDAVLGDPPYQRRRASTNPFENDPVAIFRVIAHGLMKLRGDRQLLVGLFVRLDTGIDKTIYSSCLIRV
jgi:hypothetical protein